MNREEEIKDLYRLKKLIKNAHNEKVRALLIQDYDKLLGLIKQLGLFKKNMLLDDERKCNKNIYNKTQKKYYEYLDSYFNNMDLIDMIIDEELEIFKKYPIDICQKTILIDHKFEEIYPYFLKFLEDFDPMLKDLFINILNSGHIIYDDELEGIAECYSFNINKLPYIIINGLYSDTYLLFSSLAHELGHVYEKMLTKNQKVFYDFNALIEVPAIFLEKLFNLYMAKNSPFKVDTDIELSLHIIEMIRRNIINNLTNKAYFNDKIDRITCKNDIDLIIINKDEYNKRDDLEKEALKDYKPMFENYLYVLDTCIANNLLKEYLRDKNSGKEMFINFVKNIYNLDLREVLTSLTSTSIMKKEISKVYNYQKKKLK